MLAGTPRGERHARSAEALTAFLRKHRPHAVAVGNGTAGRETESFARQCLKEAGEELSETMVVLVREAGASVYSASDVAREEFPQLDVTLRGAVRPSFTEPLRVDNTETSIAEPI